MFKLNWWFYLFIISTILFSLLITYGEYNHREDVLTFDELNSKLSIYTSLEDKP